MPSLLSRLFTASSHPATPEKWLVEWASGPTTSSGMYVDPDTAERLTAVWCAVRLLAEGIAGLPLLLYRASGPDGRDRERARDHPLYKILHRRPNRWQTPFEFYEMCGSHLVLRGHFFAQKVENVAGELVELVPLHPDRIMPETGGPEGFTYRYQPRQGPARTFLPSELFRALAHSRDGILGRSPITECREAVGTALAQDQFAASFFGRGANPSGVLRHPNTLSEEAYNRLQKDWAAQREGPANAGRSLILEEGMEWDQIGMKLTDAQFVEEREFTVNDIARLFRVPPHMLGDLRRATFSNIEHQSLEYLRDSLGPWLKRIEQAVWRDCLSEADQGEHYAEFLVDAVLRADFKSRMEGYAIARTYGILSANECRERENLNARDDEGGDEYLHPANMEVDSSGLVTTSPGSQQLPPVAPPAMPGRPPAPSQGDGEDSRRLSLADPHAVEDSLAAALADPLRRMERREVGLLTAALEKGDPRRGLAQTYDSHASQLEQALAEPFGAALGLAALALHREAPAPAALAAALTAWAEAYSSARWHVWARACETGTGSCRGALRTLETHPRDARELARVGLALLTPRRAALPSPLAGAA